MKITLSEYQREALKVLNEQRYMALMCKESSINIEDIDSKDSVQTGEEENITIDDAIENNLQKIKARYEEVRE